MLARLLASVATGEVSDVLKRLRVSAALYLLAAVLGLFGIGFLVFAAFVVAVDRWGVVTAALGFGIAFLAAAGIVIASLRIWSRVEARRARRRRMSDAGVLAGTAALTLLPTLLARSGGLGTLLLPLLAAAGYAIYRENARTEDPDKD
ncbi:hypothetical protein [Nitratireductor sp. ZSWI3]|uniref:hypothetical protein n=1 Tax=Nitratireductor sp. ZSWI3 TaxID=2966359 RepID=UPI00214FC145|nr:hypothetical protein [Nitratireductor sp. ZSWI3]MCR4267069.1 hypothetical protein [Nitratireductor sp. ZSWI3]